MARADNRHGDPGVNRDVALERLRAAKDSFHDSPIYSPGAFDLGIQLLTEGAVFVVRRAWNDLWDEIVVSLVSGGEIQLPLANATR